jgi:hypothetical protein
MFTLLPVAAVVQQLSGTGGPGGLGGGGNGATYAGTPGAGTANTGGGGGGAGMQADNTTVAGGKGGSGVVVLRYITNAPLISTQPTNTTVKSYTDATISVETTSTPSGVTRTYQWQSSTDNGANYSNISGAALASYTFRAIEANDNNKRYRVIVTDTATDSSLVRSTTSDAAILTVSPEIAPGAPTITGITVSNAQLSVAFTEGTNTGSSITKYQYSTDNGSTWKDRANGTTTSPLIITTTSAVSPANLANRTAYNVRIRAFNSIAGAQSLVVSATPYAAPTLAAPATIPTATAGTAYTLTMPAASGGSDNYTYSNPGPGNKLPAGLDIDPVTGVISGIPTVAGTISGIQITVTDTTSGLTALSSVFSITVNSGTQSEISILTRFGTNRTPLVLLSTGGSGGGAFIYVLAPNQPSACSLASGELIANFGDGISGSCSVIATRVGINGFTDKSSSPTSIFFTAYVAIPVSTPVAAGTISCPAGTAPSAPTGIGISSCIQVTPPVISSPTNNSAAPKITRLLTTSGVLMTSGPVGATVVIEGTALSDVTRVQFGTKSQTTFSNKTATSITLTVPAGATTGRIMAFSPTGTAMSSARFEVADTLAPIYRGGSVITGSPTQLSLNFDDNINTTGVLASYFAVTINTTISRSIVGIAISGTTITLTLDTAITNNQNVIVTYTSPGDTNAGIRDAIGNKTATFTTARLDNSVP